MDPILVLVYGLTPGTSDHAVRAAIREAFRSMLAPFDGNPERDLTIVCVSDRVEYRAQCAVVVDVRYLREFHAETYEDSIAIARSIASSLRDIVRDRMVSVRLERAPAPFSLVTVTE